MQRIIGGGSYAGANAGATINFEYTNADTVEQLRGFGVQAGGSGGQGLIYEAGGIAGDSYSGGYFGIGVGGGATPGAGFVFPTYTTPYNAPASAQSGSGSRGGGCPPKCF